MHLWNQLAVIFCLCLKLAFAIALINPCLILVLYRLKNLIFVFKLLACHLLQKAVCVKQQQKDQETTLWFHPSFSSLNSVALPKKNPLSTILRPARSRSYRSRERYSDRKINLHLDHFASINHSINISKFRVAFRWKQHFLYLTGLNLFQFHVSWFLNSNHP